MESIATRSGFEVFATSENGKIYGKRENFLKIHCYVPFNQNAPTAPFVVGISVVNSGITEHIGDVTLNIRKDNSANNGGVYDNFVIFDFRDIANSLALNNGQISFQFQNFGNPVVLQVVNSSLGFNLIEQHPIKRIPFHLGNFPFYFSQTFWRYFASSDGVNIVALSEETNIMELLNTYGNGAIFAEPPMGVPIPVFSRQFTHQFGIKRKNIPNSLEFINLDCRKDYELIQWTGSNGLKKSWWFEVFNRQVYTSETLQLLDYERNNRYVKDANVRVELRSEHADYATRCYVADIVQADDVEAVNTSGSGAWNVSILIETQALSVGEPDTYSDVILTSNFENYDRI